MAGRLSGSFDASAFNAWLQAVIKSCSESGHLEVALSEVGKVLPYAPPDPSGLWLPAAIAEALNTKDAERMRKGYIRELFNRRGVHGFSAGADEDELAAKYHSIADEAEGAGYHRLAKSLKSLSASYSAEAKRERARNPYEE